MSNHSDNKPVTPQASLAGSWTVQVRSEQPTGIPPGDAPRVRAPIDDNLSVDLGNGLTLYFATPILRLIMPDAASINAGLRATILQKARQDAGKVISNVGGWQSRNDLLEWGTPEIDTLKRWIADSVRQMAHLSSHFRTRPAGTTRFHAYAWANVNRDGHFNSMHLHPGEHWSGVYYVDPGEPDRAIPLNGVIEFPDPRPAARAMPVPGFKFDGGLSVIPQAGTLLLFPSWLEHGVTPYRGTGERISIAFNCTLA